ncbi:MAG: flagellin, partial [Lachnospiraceae bacterium]
QVADGALAEVSDMLHRITELAVQAANDTNTKADRDAIQDEINKIIEEIDNISNNTMFNTMPVFKGRDIPVLGADGTPLIKSDIPVSQMQLADISLGKVPFRSGNDGNSLSLQAIATNYSGVSWNLIFGNGSTSDSSFILTYDDGTGTDKSCEVKMGDITPTNYQTSGDDTWLRDFAYTNADGVDITITQKVVIENASDNEKNYKIEYALQNNNNKDLKIDFMFHADTAYNNNDRCEGYYINGSRVNRFSVYSESGSPYTNGSTSSNVIANVPDSFSIVDVDNALSFAEKITIDSTNKPDSLSIGRYSSIDEWDYYDRIRNDANNELGTNAVSKDLGFSLMWHKDIGANASQKFNFTYGIIATGSDANLTGIPVNKDLNVTTVHSDERQFWIQSGGVKDSGMFVDIDEMDSNILGIQNLDVSNHENAGNAISVVSFALKKVSDNRSNIGAQQNRLEHAIAYDDNTSENTSAAESRIRDLDMAEGMVEFSKHSILEQAGQSVLSQANQSTQGVLTLLQ